MFNERVGGLRIENDHYFVSRLVSTASLHFQNGTSSIIKNTAEITSPTIEEPMATTNKIASPTTDGVVVTTRKVISSTTQGLTVEYSTDLPQTIDIESIENEVLQVVTH